MSEIHLVRRGGNALKPKDGDSTRIAEGSVIKFTVEPGVVGTTIHFDDTPFDSNDVDYNKDLALKAKFNAADPQKNSYRYKCHALGPNGEKLDSEGGGGVVEIVQN